MALSKVDVAFFAISSEIVYLELLFWFDSRDLLRSRTMLADSLFISYNFFSSLFRFWVDAAQAERMNIIVRIAANGFVVSFFMYIF